MTKRVLSLDLIYDYCLSFGVRLRFCFPILFDLYFDSRFVSIMFGI